MKPSLLLPSFTQGFALVTPRGSIMDHTYRETADAAIATVFDLTKPADKAMFDDDGYTVQFVYARIFVPQNFSSKPDLEGAKP